jgi:hypothetical protein
VSTLQELRQASIRAITGTEYDYNGDWSALFDFYDIASGTWNERLLAFINDQLNTSYDNLPEAQQAFAVDQGFDDWEDINEIVLSLAEQLLGAETDGLSIDFTDATLVVRDTTTTSNAWDGADGDVQEFWRSRSFTSYASPSPKITRDSSGTYTYRPHNLCGMSERFDSGTWTTVSLTLTHGATTAPDGTTTATRAALVDAANTHRTVNASGGGSYSNGVIYTKSIYAKYSSHPYIQLPLTSGGFGANAYANFDIQNGTVGTVGASATATITSVGDGWYRCTVTAPCTASIALNFQIYLVSGTTAAAVENYDPNSTNSLFIWGPMVNAGPTALTYVPTRAHNLVLQSQTLDNASWTATSCTVTANSVAAPDGTTTAETLALVDASSTHAIAATAISWTSGLTYTISVYAKANTHSFIQIQMPAASSQFSTDAWANFNVSTGATSAAAAATATATDVGNGWYRCSITCTATATASGAYNILLVSAINATRAESWDPNSTNSLYAWGAQVELASSPGKYVTTTTAAVYSANYDLPREWDSAGDCQGLLVEEARTNICLYARDLTQSAYTKTSATAALTATGVGGTANTASTLTATAANGTAVQNITSASAARSLSMFVKRRTGTGTVTISHGATTGSELVTNGTFASDIASWTDISTGTGTIAWHAGAGDGQIELVRVDGSNIGRAEQAIAVTAGKLYRISVECRSGSGASLNVVVGSVSAGSQMLSAQAVSAGATGHFAFRATASPAYITLYSGSNATTVYADDVSLLEVAETDITSSINSSTWTRVSVTNETITNPTICIKLATSGDAIDVDYCQSEAGAFITSPIYTGSASVTRAGDNIFCATSVFAYSQSAVTMYGKCVAGVPTSAAVIQIYDGTNNERIILWKTGDNPTFQIIDGGSNVASIDAGSWPGLSAGKIAGSAAANDAAASFNGGAVGTDTSVTMPTVYSICIGNLTSTTQFDGHIQQVMILPRAMSDAELVVVTT